LCAGQPPTPQAQTTPVRGTGWSDPTPLGPLPGVSLCDRLMDAQDRKDRAELIAFTVNRAARIVDAAIAARARGAIATPVVTSLEQPTSALAGKSKS